MDNAVDTGTILEDVASGDAASLVGGWMKASWGMLSVEKILWTVLLLAVCLVLFAFTSLLGWSYYGERGLSHLTGTDRLRGFFRVIFLLTVALGSVGGVTKVWALSDICNGLMAVPNLLAVAVLAPEAIRELRRKG